ncbi:uncharacterized protein BJ171DRAFT_258001 [Polychytrium aggregatum]|uniref:uncharacterized protein n=1 Tax=Polychytrium aggregatum TaxID=110093 RepID=UPI0022FDFE10|nr:uncharacterized protein BJ171DRAFT_258001 [Polychytrium aggregatum]KAI9207935.1 hypothetical protein BJ171DRAFT_258001 [Polychytrium aggregatum]
MSKSKAAPIPLDMTKFDDEEFNSDSYVYGILATNAEDDIKNFFTLLEAARESAASVLQKNVYRNYTEFVTISKEISKLESDMLTLRGLLNELRDVNEILRPDEPVEQIALDVSPVATELSPTEKKEGMPFVRPQEMLDFRKMQMEKLFDLIEGVQKMIPESSSRYLARDGSKTQYWEVNPSNIGGKKQCVHFFVLSDYLLVTTKKKSLISGKSKMTVDKCLKLSEIAIIDMKDSEITNAFKIMRHPNTFVYRAESPEDKRSLLAAIKRVTDAFLVPKKEPEKETKELRSSTPLLTAQSEAIAETVAAAPTKIAVVKDSISMPDAQFLFELPDELDVLIAHREFDNAVALMERGRSILVSNSVETPRVQIMKYNLEDRISRLASTLCGDLSSPICTKKQGQANIALLVKLGFGKEARDIFLTSRTKAIHHHIRLLKMDGEVASYVSDLADVVFQMIRNTCDWYKVSFHDSTMASGFMTWVRGEIIYFSEIFRRHVFYELQEFSVISDCLHRTMENCELLREAGLDLSFLIEQLLLDDVKEAINRHSKLCRDKIIECINTDNFSQVSNPKLFEDAELSKPISQSVCDFYEILMTFGSNVGVLMSIALYDKIVTSLADFFSCYLDRSLELFQNQWTPSQYNTMVFNADFVVNDLVPRVSTQLAARFERAIPELENHRQYLQNVIRKMNIIYIKQMIARLIGEFFKFQVLDYTSGGGILDTAKPSSDMIKLCEESHKILQHIPPAFKASETMKAIVEGLFELMLESVQQFILDMHFFLQLARPFISEKSTSSAHQICEKALRSFVSQNSGVTAPLKGGEWYDARVKASMQQTAKSFPEFTTTK